jgi:hypothetical protein
VVDGNFSAEHMKMKYPDQDIWLSNGMGYMVEWKRYKSHLDEAVVTHEVSSSLFAVHPVMNVVWIRGLHVQIIKQLTRQIWSAAILMPLE